MLLLSNLNISLLAVFPEGLPEQLLASVWSYQQFFSTISKATKSHLQEINFCYVKGLPVPKCVYDCKGTCWKNLVLTCENLNFPYANSSWKSTKIKRKYLIEKENALWQNPLES